MNASLGTTASNNLRSRPSSTARSTIRAARVGSYSLSKRHVALLALATVTIAAAADPAFAQTAGGGGDITTFLQNIVNIITGTAGKLIAVIAICIVGIGALMGALSMRAAGGVILGVMLVFSSSWIVSQIVGS